ncbi:hypothetical protein FOQG_18037 [Fusarium oxysporum f. sp. raphani 54005]|uniref:Sugar phosphate transporter domain-containing protein n=1 Tax=Fusarium oxysporum f. sp. raphani 54005 TaxID=1089458 RepID=X0BEJ1_FUSOX|nr:hypothetical protein FOQG_18037 [Fusarium oxysporum f. sp. raphani 54005]
MLKAFAPVIVLFVAWVWGVVDPSVGDIINIMWIVSGVIMASLGEMDISWAGVAFQLSALIFEAVRVVMIQTLLSSEGLNMDPLVGLYYYAPVCAVLNLLIAGTIEIPSVSWEDVTQVGWIIFCLNALFAFLLNFVSLVLIAKTSALVTTLTGIFKNIFLIIFSIVIWQTQISIIQMLGYSMSLMGLVYYSFGYRKLAAAYHAAIIWLPGLWE